MSHDHAAGEIKVVRKILVRKILDLHQKNHQKKTIHLSSNYLIKRYINWRLTIGNQALTLVGDTAYRKNFEHSENDLIFISGAVGKGLSSTSRVMGEFVATCNSSLAQCRRDVYVGYVKVIFPDSASRYQTSVFTSVGVGKNSDGRFHKTILVGLSVAKKPN